MVLSLQSFIYLSFNSWHLRLCTDILDLYYLKLYQMLNNQFPLKLSLKHSMILIKPYANEYLLFEQSLELIVEM